MSIWIFCLKIICSSTFLFLCLFKTWILHQQYTCDSSTSSYLWWWESRLSWNWPGCLTIVASLLAWLFGRVKEHASSVWNRLYYYLTGRHLRNISVSWHLNKRSRVATVCKLALSSTETKGTKAKEWPTRLPRKPNNGWVWYGNYLKLRS